MMLPQLQLVIVICNVSDQESKRRGRSRSTAGYSRWPDLMVVSSSVK